MIIIKESQRKWWITLAISACLAIVYLDQTGVALALDTIERALGLSTLAMQWVVNSYLLTLAIFILLGGRFADIFGHRSIFLIGLSLFLLASILCATADVGWWLIVSRALQGIGGSLLIPTSLVLIANSTNIKERGKMIGISISFASIFLAFGPTIGGLLTQFWGWRLIFWINVPIGILSVVLTILAVPKSALKNSSSKIDWFGFISLALSLVSLIVAFMQVSDWGWGSSFIIGLLINFIVFFSLFIFIESRVQAPLVNLKFFRNRNFLGGNAILFLLQTCHISSAVFWVLYLQNVLGFSMGKAGLFILPVTLPVIFCAQLSGRLLDRYGAQLPIITGMLLAVTGVAWVALFANSHNYYLLFMGFLLYGVGAPLVILAAMTCIISSVSPKDQGAASGIANAIRQMGGALGLSVIGSIITYENNKKLDYFISHAIGPLHNLKKKQLEQFLINPSLDGARLGLSLNDIASVHHELVKAYASAFGSGMIVASFFACVALGLSLKLFKKSEVVQGLAIQEVG